MLFRIFFLILPLFSLQRRGLLYSQPVREQHFNPIKSFMKMEEETREESSQNATAFTQSVAPFLRPP